MQCLFCGKELALLKRLRGGGEFCSEAHRKDYQEQYEQLALARLQQAKPPSEPQSQVPLGRPSPVANPAADPAGQSLAAKVPAPARPEPQVQGRPVRMIEPPASSPLAALKPAEESSPAPLAGFVNEPLVPAVTTFQHGGSLEFESVMARGSAHSLSLPEATTASGLGESLPPAPRVGFELSMQALDHHTRTSERGVELREFTAPPPIIELHLRPATGTEPAGAANVMEMLMSPHPPQKATPWLAGARGFRAAPAELGELARLDFTTTGFAYADGGISASSGSPQATPSAPEPPPAQVQPAPEVAPPPAQAPPELVTTALPVTLHGLAAPRGKAVQTFTSAIVAASDVQIPQSASLPLRPTIVFGPVPAPAAAATPVQPKPAPEKTESSFKSPVVPVPKAVPLKRPVTGETVAPEIKAPKVSAPATPAVPQRAEPRRAELPMEPRQESPAPQRLELSSDSALPSLRLETTESAWAKLSSGVKIGIAAAVIVGLSGIAYLVTRGGGKTASEAPAAPAATSAVASGVPISGGWIDDWANAARSRRHISLLSGSAKLSDYRLEFQAQIQTKAIGWIFRGLNPRNYYVAKLETTTPGLDPTVALVHFAVIDGQDENRVMVPLPMKVRVDTNYKIRFDAVGNHFTTWVQDKKIDEWTDSRFGSGGVGLFSERDEQAALQGTVSVVALVPKN